MKTQKFKSYLVLALIVFVIYLILYLVVFSFSGEGKLNYWPMLSKGVILALVIPLFSKKFSPIPPVHDEKSAKKGKKSLDSNQFAYWVYRNFITCLLFSH